MSGKGEEKARRHMGISDERGSENDRNRKRNLGSSQLYFLGASPLAPPEKAILGGRGAGNVSLYLSRWLCGWKRRQLSDRLVPGLAAMRDILRVESGLFAFGRGRERLSNLRNILRKEEIISCHSF